MSKILEIKKEMDHDYEKNKIDKNDSNYQYDVRADFS